MSVAPETHLRIDAQTAGSFTHRLLAISTFRRISADLVDPIAAEKAEIRLAVPHFPRGRCVQNLVPKAFFDTFEHRRGALSRN